eukprot:c7128_g1_i1.p1 GENE.c7128_g1_i1~~c7128_g1_i1.p1  ORF type:complete len:185 (+),score=38.16 c7128_g1_i1:30-557(+)
MSDPVKNALDSLWALHEKSSAMVGAPAQGAIGTFVSHNWGNDDLGRDNHERVQHLATRLKVNFVTAWFDGLDMHGRVDIAMSDGIDRSKCVVVCVTSKYIQKCKLVQDNCANEFAYASVQKPLIFVAMEPSVLDPSRWEPPVGPCSECFDLSCETSDPHFEVVVKKIVEKIRSYR